MFDGQLVEPLFGSDDVAACREGVGTCPGHITLAKVLGRPAEMSSGQLELIGSALIAGRGHLTTTRALLVLVHVRRA